MTVQAPATRAAARHNDVREQTRARYPDRTGFVERGGVRIFYEVYGDGQPTVLLLPTWSIIHSRHWKTQIPYLARHTGSSRSTGAATAAPTGRPTPRRTPRREFAADALAVMDATGDGAGGPGGAVAGRRTVARLAADHPERVERLVLIAPAVPLRRAVPVGPIVTHSMSRTTRTTAGRSTTATTGGETTADFLEFFFAQCLTEPHSTKQIEDAVGWGLETDAETLVADQTRAAAATRPDVRAPLAPRSRCPILVIHGDRRSRSPAAERGAALAEARPAATLVSSRAVGHIPHARDPVRSTCSSATSSRSLAGPSHDRSRRATVDARPLRAPRAGPCTSRRRSASGTPSATSPSPTSSGRCGRTSRSTGSPSIRSRRCSRRAANGSIP